MREILFRGKQVDNGEWVEGYYVRLNSKEHRIYNGYAETDCGEFFPDCYTVNPKTVGQYTGLTDKNGKKIFEGDIVQEDDVIHNGEIQIKGKVGSISLEKSCFVVLYNDTWDFLQTNAKVVLVIGNIHDNPELLEVTE